MKKLMVLALIAIAFTSFANTDLNTVSYKVKNQFTKEFTKAANVKWKVTEQFAKASFDYDGVQMVAFYNIEGDLIATSKVFALDKLPKDALNTITIKYVYPLYQLQECIEMTTADGERDYYISFKKGNNKLVLKVTPGGNIERL